MKTHVVPIATPELGDRSYLLHDGSHALVVDPQRDVDRVLALADVAGVEITHVAETHLHNDYLSGGLELARVTGAAYLVAGGEPVAFKRVPIAPSDRIAIGDFEVEVVATPGHTPHHVAFVVREDDVPVALCSGGSMLYGTVGRTDLSGAARTEELSRAQYRSVRSLAATLPDEVEVLPTHGFGSFCSSSAASDVEVSTLAEQRRVNAVLGAISEPAFVALVRAGLGPYPSYYATMGPRNRVGAPPMPPPPVLVDPVQLHQHLAHGDLLVDLRPRRRFAEFHLSGSLSFELTQPFTTYLGWVVPEGCRIVLLAPTYEDLDEAARCLARIGRDGLFAVVPGALDEIAEESRLPTDSFGLADFADLAELRRTSLAPYVLDVRQSDEWRAGHLEGAVHRFVAQLFDDGTDLPRGPIFVHCATGYRAGIAASLLERSGHEVVLVDDDFERAVGAGLSVVVEGPAGCGPLGPVVRSPA